MHAQSDKGTVSGKVTDSHGLPLPSVSISLPGTTMGTLTDEKGNYYLKVPAGSYKILASSVGYFPAEIEVIILRDQATDVPIELAPAAIMMQDVRVSGVKINSATATRTLMQIQDVPQSIAVLGQRVIRQQAAFDLATLTRNISGLTFTGNYGGAGSSQFFNARGFDLNDAQNYRWNGMMIWNWGNHYADNIEQMEFLKGPASILFGDVAPGGVMNFVTKKPLSEFVTNLNFKTGSWGLLRPSVDITGPLSRDRSLRFRLNASLENSGSFRDNVTSERTLIAPTLAWDITPKLSVQAEAVFKKSRATDDAGLVSPDGTVAGLGTLAPSLYLGDPARNYLHQDQSYFLTLTYELSKTWRIRSTGFYSQASSRPFGMWFDQPDANGNFARREYGFNQKSGNGSANFDVYGSFYSGAIKHTILVGAEYQATGYRQTNAGELHLLDTSNIYRPIFRKLPAIEPPTAPYRPYVSVLARSGLYVQDQLMFFNEKLHLLLGLRAGTTRQGNHYYQDQLPGTEYEGYTDDIIRKQVLTPRLGLVFKPQPWVSLYASYAEGYEVNAPDLFAQNYQEYRVPPPTNSNQLELGSKANVLDNKLGVTLSLFQINKHNPYGYVYLDPENPNFDEYVVYYEGHHRSRGIELDADGKLLPTLFLTAGAAYTQTRVMADPGYPTGNVLPNAPKVTANAWLHYEPSGVVKGFSVGTGLFYKGKFFSGLVNDPNLQIPASYTLDVALGYQYRQMSAQLNVVNLTNQVSYLNPWQFNLFDVRPLRQFVLTLNCKLSKPRSQ
ncbi:iron complex outermembrane receptor protein [Rhabdobacter roseus]|uniref:Iron complex outermembrane receptor protein n=1 Tax=Rhabdobacter roseus TaxID=1655419 RepID=A0A840TL22_9BACT|nr:iron complex outermembrane receptor protein [Rhabdobacter roseus]